ncbi:MAG: response regulator [Planctomycetes bacterium]|nr:response regulator [Planctomycetota bacterium]
MKTGKSWNVLVVDDQPGDIFLVKTCIEDYPNVLIHPAFSVREALQFIHRVPPFVDAPIFDLVLLDLNLPMGRGAIVIPAIRSSPACAQTKIVIFTSSKLPRDVKECMALGADDFVAKPADWPQWSSTILELMHKHLGGF